MVLAIGGIVGLLGLNIQTYHRLTYERPVATIELHQAGPQDYNATLIEPENGDQPAVTRNFEIHGDEPEAVVTFMPLNGEPVKWHCRSVLGQSIVRLASLALRSELG